MTAGLYSTGARTESYSYRYRRGLGVGRNARRWESRPDFRTKHLCMPSAYPCRATELDLCQSGSQFALHISNSLSIHRHVSTAPSRSVYSTRLFRCFAPYSQPCRPILIRAGD